MDELINRIKGITNLSELKNIDSINANDLIYAISKSERYDLFQDANIKLDLEDNETLEKLIDFLLSDEDILYYMRKNNFSFSKVEIEKIFNIVFQKYQYSYEFEKFLNYFFDSKESFNVFVKENQPFFEKYINERGKSISYSIRDRDSIVELILKGNHVELIESLENYSLSNLILLAEVLKNNDNNSIRYYLGNYGYAQNLFKYKSSFNPNEFIELLSLLKDESRYDRKIPNSEGTIFTNLVKENIDYLIEVVSLTKTLPKCLIESSIFRNECIKRNRIDLAVKCVLPLDIMKNDALISAYCTELNIDSKDFLERNKWLLNYHEKNNNIFNTILATSLRNNIFSFNKEHFERFINDIEIQMAIEKLNDKELVVLSKILNLYNYKEYDVSFMIVNIIKNISKYQELINSLNLESISEQDLRKLVCVLQLSDNPYQINSFDSLQKYDTLKKQSFLDNFNSNDLTSNKERLLNLLFNIDLKEAQYINSKYCQENHNIEILDNLKNSELPPQIYNYLILINAIVKCNNTVELFSLYNSLNETKIYNSEIPFEPYLRAQYTKLYSQSLYRIDERNQIYGPQDSISNEADFNGKKVQISIPRANFNFFVHCVGSCSTASDISNTNYKIDWLDRPQVQDHFVACSYINEKGIYSIRAQGSIIFGFDTLDNGAIIGMGNTDIDSIGRYAKAYDGSRELQEGNGSRARYFVPSEILKTINDGYNEIVIERRNNDHSKSEEFKRKPDYIIMMAESMEQDNFNYLESLYQNQLFFISEEDKKEIQQIGSSSELSKFLVKYKDVLNQMAIEQKIPLKTLVKTCISMIMKAKYFEDCLKAASEFDIPLVIVDKAYYFNKILAESEVYDDDTKNNLSELYSQISESNKAKIFNTVAVGGDVTKFMNVDESPSIHINI